MWKGAKRVGLEVKKEVGGKRQMVKRGGVGLNRINRRKRLKRNRIVERKGHIYGVG